MSRGGVLYARRVSTVDPNASKPSRRRVLTTSVDPRVEDPSGSIERGSGRARGRTQRSAGNGDGAGKDPLARLEALDAGRLDTDHPMPDIVPAEAPRRPPTATVAEVPLVPIVRTTTIDAAIPTGAMPAVEAPIAPPTSVVQPSGPPTAVHPVTAVEPATESETETRGGSRPVIWRRTGRPRVRRVTRVLRHIDTWSVFKVALVFNLVAYLVTLTAAVLLWNVAYRTGTIDNVEKFFEQFGWSSFEFRGGELYHNLWIAGLFVTIGLTGLAVMLATLFNLITDLVGGIRVSVLEEEVITRASQRATADHSVPAPATESTQSGATPG
jgi:Transmembrane domain of unknown function (DUF3566)